MTSLTHLERAAADLSPTERQLIKVFAAQSRNNATTAQLALFWQELMLSMYAAEDHERDLLAMLANCRHGQVESSQTEGKVSDPLAAGQAPPPDGRTATPLNRESASAPRGRWADLVSRFLPSKDCR